MRKIEELKNIIEQLQQKNNLKEEIDQSKGTHKLKKPQ